MKYKDIKLIDFENYYKDYLKKPTEEYLNLTTEKNKTLIAIPEDGEYIKELKDNQLIVNTYHNGGIIVVYNDGITLFAFTNRNNNPLWGEKLAAYLRSKNINASVIDNDVIIDNYKVAGFMDKFVNKDIQFFGIHISINVDLEEIKEICDKPMMKIPKGLSDYGITRDEILKVLSVK